MTDDYIPITVEQARALAEAAGKDAIIIVALDRAHNRTHATTWGKTAPDKAGAAEVADKVTAELFGLPLRVFEDYRLDAARLKEENELLREDLPRVGAVPAGPDYTAEVAVSDGGVHVLRYARPADARTTCVALCNLPSLFMGVMTQRDHLQAEVDRLREDLRRHQGGR